jgi:hypothetical protein
VLQVSRGVPAAVRRATSRVSVKVAGALVASPSTVRILTRRVPGTKGKLSCRTEAAGFNCSSVVQAMSLARM